MLVVCVVHGGPAEAFKYFTAGPACRSCVLRAERIYAVYTIDGVRFHEELKEGSARGQRADQKEVNKRCSEG